MLTEHCMVKFTINTKSRAVLLYVERIHQANEICIQCLEYLEEHNAYTVSRFDPARLNSGPRTLCLRQSHLSDTGPESRGKSNCLIWLVAVSITAILSRVCCETHRFP